MSSSVQRKRIRKSPDERRAEIVEAATAIALTEGLECVTLRRIADELDVRPGLISHYFPSVEDLVAEAFGSAASAELDRLVPVDPAGATPTEQLAAFFGHTSGAAYDAISRLWINARHLSRYRDVLRDRVAEQEAAWRGRLEGVVRRGVEREEFRTPDPYVTTIQILVVLDGLGAHANTDTSNRPAAVTRMAVATAERELGLPSGALDARPATAPDAAPEPAAAPGSDPAAEPVPNPAAVPN
ncbi:MULTISPECIES: TetR/AcrR family transcriptional regulator [Streptomyces]|uniref:TetR family transcriptional regulator C-terminal domain-containing protein n=1 Tax=Streptomyces solicathayae TaxID=3081768 RepID=A0ABZ0M1D3_9ACTN|nr:TetR family transcriptional regulator C-terminal domain-containing protein [Streptomyces sp. HUAS YS2]WOX24869.1 TetR family transcriptional regulator C-terminal domain-containing protein [Streptomyces sp. HUAS YS2]